MPKIKSIPAYHRIMNSLRDRIRRGELKPGDPVESERDLARHFSVSAMTARHALAQMELQGMVERRSRVGTFVAAPRIQFNRLLGFSEQASTRGFTARSKVLSARRVADDLEIPPRLGLPGRALLVRIERLRLGNSQPLALELCFLPAERFGTLLDQPLDRRSLFSLIEQQYGVPIAYADEQVDATSADTRTAHLLEVAPGSPLLRVRQVLYSGDGLPVAYSLALYRAEHHSLSIRRFR
jgi:GntR family transcriptional regulator